MHYFTVNATSHANGEKACAELKERLESVHGKKVGIVRDSIIGPEYSNNPELFKKLTCPDTCNEAKIVALLSERERIYKEQLMPALSEYDIVLYHGGMLYDSFWMDVTKGTPDTFPQILRENLEFLQSIGGVAYPAGAVIALGEDDELNDFSHFKSRCYLIGNSMARYKVLTYTLSETKDIEMLLTP